MNENELQELVKKNSTSFRMLIGDKSFSINEINIFKTDNPITEPTTRGGVYFAELKELKIQATIHDTSISKYLSKAMLGPNKDFLDIVKQVFYPFLISLHDTQQSVSYMRLHYIY